MSGSLDELWNKTQLPELHERWDLRFTTIEYLPRPDGALPQRFRYTTHIGFGLRIHGEGETVGSRTTVDGVRASALKFWSDDPKSLIHSGSGYWKYIPQEQDIRFLTRYDYSTRCGMAGRVIDRILFRPLMGWATAWSFDRLRLWIEKGIDPWVSLWRSVLHAFSRLALAATYLYIASDAQFWMPSWFSLALGVILLVAWRVRQVVLLTLGSTALLIARDVLTSQYVFSTPPVTFVLLCLIMSLSLVGYWSSHTLPSARRCIRTQLEPS